MLYNMNWCYCFLITLPFSHLAKWVFVHWRWTVGRRWFHLWHSIQCTTGAEETWWRYFDTYPLSPLSPLNKIFGKFSSHSPFSETFASGFHQRPGRSALSVSCQRAIGNGMVPWRLEGTTQIRPEFDPFLYAFMLFNCISFFWCVTICYDIYNYFLIYH